jgi:peptidoglycan lytic transglycosylase G
MTKARLIRLVAIILIAACLLAGGFAFWSYRVSVAPGPLQKATTIVIARGSGLRDIAHRLAAADVIAHPRIFQIVTWLKRAQHDLRAGEYAFDPGVSMQGVLAILREGRTVVRRVTFAEGLTSKEMMAELRRTDGLEGTIPSVPSEGSLLPDTYHYSYGDTRSDIISRMAKAMDGVLAELWAKRAPDLPLTSPTEALILASIVEKETAVPAERARIAAVFINRLKKGMRIESDPTVVYGLTHGEGPLGRALTRDDLKIDHPYNTYRIAGLPPGPICNPGKDSLAAVMNPLKTDELYFVADGTGGHVFARTLEEHNRNVAKWRKFKRANGNKP